MFCTKKRCQYVFFETSHHPSEDVHKLWPISDNCCIVNNSTGETNWARMKKNEGQTLVRQT